MSSSIFFRFKSRKDALQINFDGTSLSVFEVKREIMSIARLGDGKDFDLDISSPDTNEVYDDDTTQIPRSTTVIVRRQPAQRPGAGRASRYVTGQMPLHARIHHNAKGGADASASTNGQLAGEDKSMTEEERLLAIMNASNTQLKADLEMSANKPVMRPTFNKATPVPDKPLPPGYVCHRCGGKGHWIQACPTNTDPAYDGKHKFKRTTGIPRSMLEVVELPDGVGEDGKIDPSKIDKGLMYTANGEWVRARPDQAAWQKFQDQQKVAAEKAQEVAEGDQELRERGLECSIDNRPFADPTKTPCCGKTYCRDCIENALLDNDLTCPNCGKQIILENLTSDDEAVTKMAEYETEKKAEKQRRKDEEPASPDADAPSAAASPKPADVKSPAPDTTDDKAASIGSPKSETSNSKKRSAESELENTRKPSNPAANKAVSTAAPTGPKAAAAQPPAKPVNMADWVNQMNTMANNTPNDMNAFNNPMMMYAMNNMGMPMGMMPGMMGMPDFNMMNGMNGMGYPPNMNTNMGMNMNGMGNMGWQNGPQQQRQGWMNNNNNNMAMNNNMAQGNAANGGENGAYFRQPVNPHRHQGKQRRQRSVDYREM